MTVGTLAGRPAAAGDRTVAGQAAPAGAASLTGLRRLGAAVLVVQLAGLVAWSVLQYHRFALTMDYSIYDQAFTLIAHGHLDPFDTLNGMPFWQHDGELVMWLLAPLWWLWPHGPVLLLVQDAALVGAEAVVFAWLCDVVATTPSGASASARSGLVASLAVLTGLVALVADPWVTWSVTWDFHVEPVGVLFVALLLRALWRDDRRARRWLWAGLALACGSVVATYVVAVGGSAAVVAWRRWSGDRGRLRRALAVAGLGLAWSALLAVAGGNRGADLASGYGYLAAGVGAVVPAQLGLGQVIRGMVAHPLQVAAVLWHRRLDLYASVAPAGMLGLMSWWTAPLVLLVLMENGLNHYVGFAVPSFQDVPVFLVGAAGTVLVLLRLGRRFPTTAVVVSVALAANAAAWGAVWLPRTASQWVRVSSSAASVLAGVEARIPAADQVIVSQGVSGRFSGRRWDDVLFGPGRYPVETTTVWVVVAPNQGIETLPVSDAQAVVGDLAGPLGATLVARGAGVWAFRWRPAPGTRWLDVPVRPTSLAGWVVPGPAGRAVTAGLEGRWHAQGTGGAGYVVAGDYWRVRPARYRAGVTLSSTVPVNIEVWDDTGGVLLGRRTVDTHGETETVTQVVDADRRYPDALYGGVGPLRIDPIPPPPGDVLEVRVWTPAGGSVRVDSTTLARTG